MLFKALLTMLVIEYYWISRHLLFNIDIPLDKWHLKYSLKVKLELLLLKETLTAARYALSNSPPNVFQVISTLLSEGMSSLGGVVGSANDIHSAQRQSTFQFSIPVLRLRMISCCFCFSDKRIMSMFCIIRSIPW